jgi:WD40 repeat protein
MNISRFRFVHAPMRRWKGIASGAVAGSTLACAHPTAIPVAVPVPLITADRPACAESHADAQPSSKFMTGVPMGEQGRWHLRSAWADDRMAVGRRFALSWSPDGSRVVTTSDEGIIVWSAESGEEVRRYTFAVPFWRPALVRLSPDGRYAVRQGEVIDLEHSRGFPLPYELPAPRFAIGREAVISWDHRVYDFLKSEYRFESSGPASQESRDRTFWPEVSRAMSGGLREILPDGAHGIELVDGELRAGLLGSRAPERRWQVSEPAPRSLGISPRGGYVAVLGNRVQIWSLSSGGRVVDFPDSTIDGIAFCEAASLALVWNHAAGGNDSGSMQELSLLDLTTGQQTWQRTVAPSHGYRFSRSGERFAAVSDDAELFDLSKPEGLYRSRDGHLLRSDFPLSWLSPELDRIAVGDGHSFHIENVDTRENVVRVERTGDLMARSRDGASWVSGRYELQLRSAGECRVLLPGDHHPYWARFIGDDRLQIAYFPVRSQNAERIIDLTAPPRLGTWDAKSGRILSIFQFPSARVFPLDGRRVLYGGDPLRTFDPEVGTTESGGRAPFGSDGFELRLLEEPERLPFQRLLGSPVLVSAIGHHHPFHRAANSEDGHWSARVGSDRPPCHRRPAADRESDCNELVELWDVRSRRVITVPVPEGRQARLVKFSPDGRLLAIAAGDSLHLWDLEARDYVEHIALGPRHDSVSNVVFSSDARELTIYSRRGGWFNFRR